MVATNNFVMGTAQPPSKRWFDLGVFLVDCLFLAYVWDYRTRWLDKETKKGSDPTKSPDNVQLSEMGVATLSEVGVATSDSQPGLVNRESSTESKDISSEVSQIA
eukprot:5459867-Pyramimonas_sp.AAC.1